MFRIYCPQERTSSLPPFDLIHIARRMLLLLVATIAIANAQSPVGLFNFIALGDWFVMTLDVQSVTDLKLNWSKSRNPWI